MSEIKYKSLYTIRTFVRISTRRFFRDRLALFFTFAFPLIFLFVFGGLNSGGGDVSFNVAIINHSDSELATKFVSQAEEGDVLKVNKEVTTIEDAKEKMSRSELSATIELPADFGDVKDGAAYPSGEAKVLYTQNDAQAASALISILDAQFKGLNEQFVTNVTPFTVAGEQLNDRSLSAFDYMFAGLLGFAIIGMGIFGPVNVFPELKKMGILRRLSTTPLKVWQYFLATMISQAAVGLVGIALMFAVAIAVFHLEVRTWYIHHSGNCYDSWYWIGSRWLGKE